jgi:endonuclease/exonuclease/phosphatase family metal-dependent hydrolase
LRSSIHGRRRTASLPILCLVALAVLVAGCGETVTTTAPSQTENPFAAYAVGTDTTFEAATWNLHNFAESAGATTVELAAEAITALDVDVVALQEIAEPAQFDKLLQKLPGWTGVQATSDSYQNLAYIWRTATVSVGPDGVYEIFPHDGLPFPRTPLLLDLVWNGHPLLLIDNHLKCCGDGVLQVNDPGDEETRRLDACRMLADWIATEAPDRAVIVLGDLNDRLDDPPANNVFTPFLDHPDQYSFADMALALGPRQDWSYGPGRTHFDHILLTDELFAAFAAPDAECVTVRLDEALGGGTYKSQLSDHAPVAVKLDLGR